MTIYASGQKLTPVRLNDMLVAVKTADQTVNNSTAFVDDSHLTLAVDMNATYVVDAHLLFNSSTTADISFGWAAPAGATFLWSAWGQGVGATNFEGTVKTEGRILSDFSQQGGSGGQLSLRPTGLLTVGGTAGTFKLRWAQSSATAVNTIMNTGSWLRLHRIT